MARKITSRIVSLTYMFAFGAWYAKLEDGHTAMLPGDRTYRVGDTVEVEV